MSNSEKSLALPGITHMAANRAEWELLLVCASPTPNARRFGELASTVDWSHLLVLAEQHGVLGHLAARLSELDGKIVPAEKRSSLMELHRAQVVRTLGMTAELVRLLELFAGKQVPALVVKGPV